MNEHHQAVKLFEGERGLVITSIIGLIFATICALFIYINNPIILPEGNIKDAFAFNAAISIFILSIAAILPLANFSNRKRKIVRWSFILSSIYGYLIETIQHFRGVNPRYSQVGGTIDFIAGIIFAFVSLSLVIFILIVTIQFLRIKTSNNRSLLVIGIRYAFLSAIVGNIAGLWMISLQGRFTGEAGNLIVLHGVSFHALQTLLLLAWLLEKIKVNQRFKTRMLHAGCISWSLAILCIAIQISLGRSNFEWGLLPILTVILLFVWLLLVVRSLTLFLQQYELQMPKLLLRSR
ncbi:hypothetical protein GGQ92_001206 [Gracilibacillus halotolerans]|uniref:Uncharacterized protein n=1 Tax=Gracilibacillus halotolerans TaxID=74386 RepID=A0A841RLC3_9BACI|nr:hypothetical protein [Gracilibacillus halotolerans]MBB6512423.1 hypothetical protein [Gracilibacillus halotolerans]